LNPIRHDLGLLAYLINTIHKWRLQGRFRRAWRRYRFQYENTVIFLPYSGPVNTIMEAKGEDDLWCFENTGFVQTNGKSGGQAGQRYSSLVEEKKEFADGIESLNQISFSSDYLKNACI
jgi:hypothetical protein